MNDALALLGLFGPVSLIVALLVLALLSQRLGTVARKRRYYRLLYAAIALVAGALVLRLWTANTPGGSELLYIGLLAIALTLSIGVVWRYWGWLLNERSASAQNSGTSAAPQRAADR